MTKPEAEAREAKLVQLLVSAVDAYDCQLLALEQAVALDYTAEHIQRLCHGRDERKAVVLQLSRTIQSLRDDILAGCFGPGSCPLCGQLDRCADDCPGPSV